jgi:outer membrane protein TolC
MRFRFSRDNVQLIERSYEVGEIDLAEVLTIRREILDARTRYLDSLREAAETALDPKSRAGMFVPDP